MEGGGLDDEYTPSTFRGWVTQVLGGSDDKAANADIAWSITNTGSDVTGIGAIGGMVMSGLDTLYDTGKFIAHPSWSNAADIGMSAAGILPGIGSVKDVKNIAKATKQVVRNVKTTRKLKAAGKTLTKNKQGNVIRANILAPNMKVTRSYPLRLSGNPLVKLGVTGNNLYDTYDDTSVGIKKYFPY